MQTFGMLILTLTAFATRSTADDLDELTTNVLAEAVTRLNANAPKFPVAKPAKTAPAALNAQEAPPKKPDASSPAANAQTPNADSIGEHISEARLIISKRWNFVKGNVVYIHVEADAMAPLTVSGKTKATVDMTLAATIDGEDGKPKVETVDEWASNTPDVIDGAKVVSAIKAAMKRRLEQEIRAVAKQGVDKAPEFDVKVAEEKEAKANPKSRDRGTCPGHGNAVRLALYFTDYKNGHTNGYPTMATEPFLTVIPIKSPYVPVHASVYTTKETSDGVHCSSGKVEVWLKNIRLRFVGNFGEGKMALVGGRGSNEEDCRFEGRPNRVGAVGGSKNGEYGPGIDVKLTFKVAMVKKKDFLLREKPATRAVTIEKVEMTSKPIDAEGGPRFEGFSGKCKSKYTQTATIASTLNSGGEGGLAKQIEKSVQKYLEGNLFPREKFGDDELEALLTNH